MEERAGVLIIYTGGTIGCLPSDPGDPMSPLTPAAITEVLARLPDYDQGGDRIRIAGTWIPLGFYSWPTPVDSSNITPEDWGKLTSVIRTNYVHYGGFVILHGTDTLAYTASALAFMLDNLSKSVVITGSQLPISNPRSDAVQNIVTSIEVAAASLLKAPRVPEVCVFFRDKLYRGCRVTKVSAGSFDAFASPNYPPLAYAGDRIRVPTPVGLRKRTQRAFRVTEKLESRVTLLEVFPGMSPHLLDQMLNGTSLRGAVLRTFGTGNAPSTPAFLETIDRAVNNGTVIVNVTRCGMGEVEMGLYDAGAGLLSCGVVSGMDMTPEAALTKLMVILGSESDAHVVAARMQQNLKGEQRQSIFTLNFGSGKIGDEELPVTLRPLRPMIDPGGQYNPEHLDTAVLRIMGISTTDGRKGVLEFKLYLDLPCAPEGTSESGLHLLGSASIRYDPRRRDQSFFCAVTESVRALVDGRHENTITVVSAGETSFVWKKLDIAFFLDTG